jgi:hypothetical protein
MDELGEMSDALRGDLPASSSGVAIATLTANALEFISSASKKSYDVVTRIMKHTINAYNQFVPDNRPRTIPMKTANGKSAIDSFVGSDLDAIEEIKIIATNPLMQTIAGRADVAEKLINAGFVKSIQEYVSILDGEPLSRITEVELSENDLMASENENMISGGEVIALATDDHAAHIRKHHSLLNDPQIRFNNEMVGNILEHIQEHRSLASSTDPMLQAMVRTGMAPQMGDQPPGGGGGGKEETISASPAMAPPGLTDGQAEPAEDILQREAI